MKQTQTFLIVLIVLLAGAIFGMYYFFENRNAQDVFGFDTQTNTGGERVTRLGLLNEEVAQSSTQGTTQSDYSDDQLVAYADLIGPSIRSGDNQQALVAIDTVLEQPGQFPAGARARAAYNSGIAYTESGDFQDVVTTLAAYKASIDDPETSDKWRARTLNNLGFAYCSYGRDPRIPGAIFGDGTYAEILEEEGGDAMAAGKRLLEWSFDIYPTPRAAVLLARDAAMRAVQTQDADVRNTAIEEAEAYLKEGATLAASEIARTEGRQNSYSNSRRYFSYLHWRNFSRATLALAGVEKYAQTYRRDYEDLFAFMGEQGLENTKEYESSCYMMYGYFLEHIDGDTDLAQSYFSKSVDASYNYNSGTDYFKVFITNEVANPGTDFLSDVVRFSYDFSRDFKAYVDAL